MIRYEMQTIQFRREELSSATIYDRLIYEDCIIWVAAELRDTRLTLHINGELPAWCWNNAVICVAIFINGSSFQRLFNSTICNKSIAINASATIINASIIDVGFSMDITRVGVLEIQES